MIRSSRAPINPKTAAELVRPSTLDRERVREGIARSLACGAASATVLRVDAAMAERALGVTAKSAWLGSKVALAKIVIPTLLIGAGAGAFSARTLFDHERAAQRPVETGSLPVDVEDLDSSDDTFSDRGTSAVFDPPARVPGALPQPREAKRNKLSGRANHSTHAALPERVHASGPTSPPITIPASPIEPAPTPDLPSHHLAEELHLMRAASAALAKNEIARTMQLLSEHAEKFPDGALRDERRALRVISLCKLDRSHFALAERDEFLSSSPRSPLTARVREACESSP